MYVLNNDLSGSNSITILTREEDGTLKLLGTTSIGGLGSLQGALVGALIVSFVRTAGIQFFPEIELAVLYLIAALVLLVKPTGLFGSA